MAARPLMRMTLSKQHQRKKEKPGSGSPVFCRMLCIPCLPRLSCSLVSPNVLVPPRLWNYQYKSEWLNVGEVREHLQPIYYNYAQRNMFVNQKKMNVRKETQTLNKNQRKFLQLENRVLELDILLNTLKIRMKSIKSYCFLNLKSRKPFFMKRISKNGT